MRRLKKEIFLFGKNTNIKSKNTINIINKKIPLKLANITAKSLNTGKYSKASSLIELLNTITISVNKNINRKIKV